MKLPAFTLVETVVALGLTGLLALSALRGVSLVLDAADAHAAHLAGVLAFEEAAGALAEDLWAAHAGSLSEGEDTLTLRTPHAVVEWFAVDDGAFARRAASARGGRFAERWDGRLRLDADAIGLTATLCRLEAGKVLAPSCRSTTVELRR